MEIKNSNFLVGIAKEDVTPELGTLLYGYPVPERPAKRVLDPLMVGVTAISQDGKTVLLISAELCCFNVDKCTEMRKVIARETNVEWENIILSAIHTHSGPITRSSAGWGTADDAYLDNLFVPQTVKAAKKALAQLQPAVMGIGFTESRAGVNRRAVDENGKVDFGRNEDGPYDPTMTLLCFKACSGEMIGSIVHFAAHPTAAARNLSITRDWPGVMIDRVEELTGAPCSFFNGAEGDIGPRVSTENPRRKEYYLYETGLIAASDVEKAYANLQAFEVPKMSLGYGKVLLPFVTPPSREDVEAEIAAIEQGSEAIEGVRASQYAQLKKVKAIYDSGEAFPDALDLDQTIIALGDLVIVPAPFECFCKISLAIRAGSPYKHTILLGLSNGSRGYMPTEDQIPFGGYEVDSFRAVGVVSLVDDTDKHFIRQNLDLVTELHGKQ